MYFDYFHYLCALYYALIKFECLNEFVDVPLKTSPNNYINILVNLCHEELNHE